MGLIHFYKRPAPFTFYTTMSEKRAAEGAPEIAEKKAKHAEDEEENVAEEEDIEEEENEEEGDGEEGEDEEGEEDDGEEGEEEEGEEEGEGDEIIMFLLWTGRDPSLILD